MSATCPISHNEPPPEFELKIFSGISQIKRVSSPQKAVGGGKRNVISAFSRASRKRLLEKMARSRNMDSGYFGTFTYPGDFTYESKDVKSHLSTFRKRIFRLLPQARIIWRMEILPRQTGDSAGEFVPHFHLLIFGIPYGHEVWLESKLSEWWDEIANHNDADVPFLRSEVKQIRSRKMAVYYASKYAAKVSDWSDSEFGRHWGFWGAWDETPSSVFRMQQAQVIEIKRLFRSYLKARGKQSLAKMFASIRQDFGISIFGLGDNDDFTGKTCAIIDFVIASERQTNSNI